MLATLDFVSHTTFALPVPSHSDSSAKEIKLPKIPRTFTIFFFSTTLDVVSHKFFFAYVSKMRKTISIG